MTRLRVWFVLSLVWLFLFYNIERIHHPMNLASVVYPMAMIAMAPVVAWRGMRSHAVTGVWTAACIAMLVSAKLWRGYEVVGASLPITVTEVVAICVTIFLGRRIAMNLGQFEEGVSEVLTMQFNGRLTPFDEGQGEAYREVRRARQFNRPLSVLALSLVGRPNRKALHRLIKEVQRQAVQQYLNSQLADLLVKELDDCGTVLYCPDHFVVVLPEADRDLAEARLQRFAAAAAAELGLQLRAGLATFPAEEVTFTGLLERAQAQMRAATAAQAGDVERQTPGSDKVFEAAATSRGDTLETVAM